VGNLTIQGASLTVNGQSYAANVFVIWTGNAVPLLQGSGSLTTFGLVISGDTTPAQIGTVLNVNGTGVIAAGTATMGGFVVLEGGALTLQNNVIVNNVQINVHAKGLLVIAANASVSLCCGTLNVDGTAQVAGALTSTAGNLAIQGTGTIHILSNGNVNIGALSSVTASLVALEGALYTVQSNVAIPKITFPKGRTMTFSNNMGLRTTFTGVASNIAVPSTSPHQFTFNLN
jgi:hypothetical protein